MAFPFQPNLMHSDKQITESNMQDLSEVADEESRLLTPPMGSANSAGSSHYPDGYYHIPSGGVYVAYHQQPDKIDPEDGSIERGQRFEMTAVLPMRGENPRTKSSSESDLSESATELESDAEPTLSDLDNVIVEEKPNVGADGPRGIKRTRGPNNSLFSLPRAVTTSSMDDSEAAPNKKEKVSEKRLSNSLENIAMDL